MADNPDMLGLAGLAHVLKSTVEPRLVDIGGVQAALVPHGVDLRSVKPLLAEYAPRPDRREGTATLTTLDSFVRWTMRHRDDGSVIYACDDIARPSLTAIIDHDIAGGELPNANPARFGRFRGHYAFPFSVEWKKWSAVSGKGMDAAAFAAFFEERIIDVAPPPLAVLGDGSEESAIRDPEILKLVATLGKKLATPTDLVRLTRGVEINVDQTAKVSINRDTGEHFVEYSEVNGSGTERLKPPNLFLIAIPVVSGGAPFLIAVHLRYRANGGKITWTLELHEPERVVESVFLAALTAVEATTGTAPLRGQPTPAR